MSKPGIDDIVPPHIAKQLMRMLQGENPGTAYKLAIGDHVMHKNGRCILTIEKFNGDSARVRILAKDVTFKATRSNLAWFPLADLRPV